jgi:hypothetical protein
MLVAESEKKWCLYASVKKERYKAEFRSQESEALAHQDEDAAKVDNVPDVQYPLRLYPFTSAGEGSFSFSLR